MNNGCALGTRLLWAVLIVMAAGGSGAAAQKAASAARVSRDPQLTLPVRLTVAGELPATARTSLRAEAAAIWARAGVRVQWVDPAAPRDSSAIRVLVGHLFDGAADGRAWPVGKLLADQSGDRIAIASVSAAQRVLAAAGHEIAPPELDAHRLGLILGRAVAHEIGHYLLGTGSHARHGLMRAQIDARDFADLRDGGFFLDDAAGRWIRQVRPRGADTDHPAARFVY